MTSMHIAPLLPRIALLNMAIFTIVQASCFNEADIYTVTTEVTSDGDVIQRPQVVRVTKLREAADAPGPRARVDHPIHDFGQLDPLTTHRHTFVIYNDGDRPLELTEGPTTCKCTVANLTQGQVLPGEKAVVSMHWNTGRALDYEHSASIYTNDPRKRVLSLKIKGQVQVLLRCEPPRLVFSRVAPGETPSATTLVYSQSWDNFELAKIEPTMPGVRHTIEEASAQERAALHANTAYRLTVTLPEDLQAGYFATPIQVTAHCNDEHAEEMKEEACELLVEGKVLRRISLYGPAVDTHGTVLMGRLLKGQGAHVKLLMKLRDEQTELKVRSITTQPESLNVRIEPYKVSGKSNLGLYHLHVELPKDAPTFRLPPNKRGNIHFEFEHPRVKQLDLPVDLVVVPRSDFDR